MTPKDVSSFKQLLDFDRQETERTDLLAGIDEAGRGPLAGPVVAATVILPSFSEVPPVFETLNDSKKLTPKKREALYEAILSSCLVGVGVATEREIEVFNIYQATRMAMSRAYRMYLWRVCVKHLNPRRKFKSV